MTLTKEEQQTWQIISEPAPEIDIYGDKRWFNEEGQLHRDNDLPAVIYADGSQFWYKNGELHRDNDLPAFIWADGSQYWWKNGRRYNL